MGRNGKRFREARGIYRDAKGFEAMIMVAGQQRTQRFPFGTGIKEMEEWLFQQKTEIRENLRTGTVSPTAPKRGTLAADARAYLGKDDVREMPSFSDRERHINWWVEQLGHRKRSRITSDDVQHALNTLKGKAGNTRNHYRTALRHLYTRLDGKHAYNPAAETKKAHDDSAEDPKGRAIDPVALGRIIHRVEPRSLTRARLALFATCGITNIEMSRLTKRSFVFEPDQSGHVTVPARHKGQGSNARTIPFMTLHAWLAAKAFVRTYERERAWGKVFSNSSLNTSFHRAADHVRDWYREHGIDEDQIERWILPDARPYDLRHTFATYVAANTQDDTVAQYLLGHKSVATTQRYTRKSIPDRIAAVVAQTHQRKRKAAEAAPEA
jgi:site-specific recombinase XerD